MKKKLIAIVLAFALIMPSFAVYAEDNVDTELIETIIRMIQNEHKYDVSREDLINGAYRGILDVLDKHSKFYTNTEWADFLDSLEGELIGIGVFIEEEEGYIRVVSPIEGAPAIKAGIKSGDLIIKVDDEDIKQYTYEKAVDKIKGEKGTTVKITVRRGNEELNFNIVREKIDAPDVTSEMKEDNIGYLRIIQFSRTVADEVESHITKLKAQGMKKLIIDVRNNPGGYLDQVIEVADQFVEKGDPIVHVDYKERMDENVYALEDALNYPTVILINKGSASASEILAGAIKFNDEGTVIGETSYGKGTVQTLFTLSTGSAMKLTTAEYFAANLKKIDGVGVVPDIVVPSKTQEELDQVKNFVPMIDDELKHFGTKGLDVYGAQQRLQFLGYDVKVTGEFSYDTTWALEKFQKDNKLEKMYAIYPETKAALDAAVKKLSSKDAQLERAIEVLKNK